MELSQEKFSGNNDYIIKKMFSTFLWTIILAEFASTTGKLIDSIVVGRLLDVTALSSINVFHPISMFVKSIASIVASGGGFLYIRFLGRNEQDKADEVFSRVLLLCLIFSLLFVAIIIVFATPITLALGAREGALFGYVRTYLITQGIGAPIYMFFVVMTAFLKINGKKKLTVTATTLMVISNVIMDIAVLTVFDFGMLGVGITTVISQLIAVAVCSSYFFRKDCPFHFKKVKLWKRSILDIFVIGSPKSIAMTSVMLRTVFLNNLLITIGGIGAVTAFSVRSNIYSHIPIGFVTALSLITALLANEYDTDALKRVIIIGIKKALLATSVTALVIIVASGPIVHLFNVTDSQIFSESCRAVILYAIWTIPNMLVNMQTNFYQATGSIKRANALLILNNIALAIPVALLFSGLLGVLGVWISFIATAVLVLLLNYAYTAYRIKKLPTIQEMLMSDYHGDLTEKQHINISIGNDMKEVVNISEKIGAFCGENQIDRRCTNAVSLCIEEMAGNVVSHAFKPGEKRYIDVRIVVHEDRITFRMRDDGAPFNPFKYVQDLNNNSAEPTFKNIGITLVMKTALDFSYYYTAEMNYIIVNFKRKDVKQLINTDK